MIVSGVVSHDNVRELLAMIVSGNYSVETAKLTIICCAYSI